MSLKIAYVMDPIASINRHKDSTFAMMEAAQLHGHENFYLLPEALFYREGDVCASMQAVRVQREDQFYSLQPAEVRSLRELDAVIMRKDPPFNMQYIYATYLLEQAAAHSLVLNRPAALRNANEKLFALHFPAFIPQTLVGSDRAQIRHFVAEYGKAILKPIDAKGGEGVFVLEAGNSNNNALLDLMTQMGQQPVVVQAYIPAAKEGDKRVLMVDGEIQAAFQRVPAAGEHRANLNAGAQAVACELTARDREICAEVGQVLKAEGLTFVGLDLIGDYLIEINVTSPTGIQEAKKLTGIDVADSFITWIEENC